MRVSSATRKENSYLLTPRSRCGSRPPPSTSRLNVCADPPIRAGKLPHLDGSRKDRTAHPMAIVSEHLDSAAWWDTVQDRTDTPISHLIDGLDDIADQAIPYGWLPGRARTFYGPDFTTWSDLADHTITSLLDRPKGGLGTVRSILIAARDAVAVARSTAADEPADAATATRRLIDRLTAYDHTLLSTRRWPLRPTPTREIARQLGVAPVNVQRNHPRAYRRFTDLLADPAHTAVTDYAHDLRRRLGPLTEEHTARQALNDLDLDLDTDAGDMLLHIAGPYSPHGAWLEVAGGLDAATAAFETALIEKGAPTAAVLTGVLVQLGISAQVAAAFIDNYPGLRRFGDKWVRWGPTIADKTEAALHLSGDPTTPAVLAATINANEESVRTALYQDPRFTRATRHTWAVRQWDIPEYTGLFSEIATRIDSARGRRRSTRALVDEITAAFPDVSESSIRSYFNAPAFVIDKGMVRRRKKADGWPSTAPLNTVRGVYRNGDNEIRVELPVTVDTLRGSGQILTPAVATALGLHPGKQRAFTGTPADINVVWRLSSLNGASIGSIRGPATTLGAELGDTIVMVFNLRAGAVEMIRIPADTDPKQRLLTLLGRRTADPVAGLARALDCHPEDVAALLTHRRDTALLALLEGPARRGLIRWAAGAPAASSESQRFIGRSEAGIVANLRDPHP